MTIDITSGIKQGCPMSGSLWCLVFDPIAPVPRINIFYFFVSPPPPFLILDRGKQKSDEEEK